MKQDLALFHACVTTAIKDYPFNIRQGLGAVLHFTTLINDNTTGAAALSQLVLYQCSCKINEMITLSVKEKGPSS